MTRLHGGFAAGALLLALALPGSASAAEQRVDGKTAKPAGEITEFSSYHRRWHGRYYARRYYRPYYTPYAYAPAPYYYGRPYYPRRYYGGYGGPGVAFRF